MDMNRYRDLFVSEAREHLRVFGDLAVSGENGGAPDETVNELFRRAHSLKGMASTMQLSSIGSLAHALEDLLGRVRSAEFGFNRQITDLLLSGCDTLTQAVELVAQGGQPPDFDDLVARVRNYAPQQTTTAASPQTTPPPPSPSAADFTFRASDQNATVRIKTSLLDRLVTLSGELLTIKHRLENQARQLQDSGLAAPLHDLGGVLRQLQQEVFQARMLPFSMIAERFPRMVHDLARKTGKEIRLQISGDSIELDRGVLELIVDPLVHLLRNAVDHGLESPAERVATGKPSTGSLHLTVSRLADHVLVVVSDDGRGIDPARIRAKALAQGLINDRQAATLSTEESLLLICTPGFSTVQNITDISGRGVGMDVVRAAIQNIGGSLTIDSTPGSGTRISLKLPISVAIIQALLVGCGQLRLAVPVIAITSTREALPEQITAAGRQLSLRQGDQELPLRSLARQFRQTPAELPPGTPLPILLTEVNGRQIGLLVDRILGQQELFVRPLPQPLASLRGIAGATLMGDGSTVFAVDVAACVGPTSTAG